MVVSPWLTLAISFIGVILIPTLVLLWRIAVNITKDRAKVASIAKSLEDLVRDKDKVHAELYNMMREDRNATNTRLRWLEENAWGHRGNSPRR